MKTYSAFIVVLIVTNTFSQSKLIVYDFKSNVSPTLVEIKKTDTILVYSIERLGKRAWKDELNTDKINLSPKYFNWSSDIRKIESLRKMALNIRQQDLCGRDLPIDILSVVTQQLYFRSLPNN